MKSQKNCCHNFFADYFIKNKMGCELLHIPVFLFSFIKLCYVAFFAVRFRYSSGVSMGIAGSFCDADFMQKYLGLRAEWVDLTEVLRRITLEIYDKDEYEKALAWIKANCKEGLDKNAGKTFPEIIKKSKVVPADKDWEFIAKFTIIIKDILFGNPILKEMGWSEESLGRNGIAGGFQCQRMWTDWLPNGDFTEAIMESSFDWNGKKSSVCIRNRK